MIIRHLSSDRMISSDYKNSTILFVVSIKIGTKIRSVYYFSFMKLIVSTFLVYKVKKCLLKSGKVSSSDGPSMPFGWSACARYTGIRSPPSGHRQPLCWATTAHKAGNECPNIGLIFGQYSFDSLRYLKCLFAMLKMTFSDV